MSASVWDPSVPTVVVDPGLRNDLASPSVSLGSSLITFNPEEVGTNVRNLNRRLKDMPSIFNVIPEAEQDAILNFTSTYNCDADVAIAVARYPEVHFPPGKFNVENFQIPANRRIMTSGKLTKFYQIAGTAIGTRTLEIVGSNVYVDDCEIYGNIATDTNEQNHALFCQATAATGSLRNVRFGNIDCYDIRGDGIYFGAVSPYTLTAYGAGDVYGDNIYRNVVAEVGCSGGEIKSITCGRVGLMAYDSEPEPYNAPVNGTRVGYIKGGKVALGASGAASPIGGAEIGMLMLNPTFSAMCDPVYAIGLTVKDGLSLRNLKSARIGRAEISGFDRCAIFTTYNGGELGACIDIDHLDVSNCSITDAVYAAYIFSSVGFLRIGRITGSVGNAGKALFSSLAAARIESGAVTIASTSYFMKSCSHVALENAVVTGGILMSGCSYIRLKDVNFAGEIFGNFCTKLSIESCVATGSTYVFNSGNDLHSIANSTLGGVYYGSGVSGRSYLAPITFGLTCIWADAAGKLRIKATAPTTDLDGTVVGTQT